MFDSILARLVDEGERPGYSPGRDMTYDTV